MDMTSSFSQRAAISTDQELVEQPEE